MPEFTAKIESNKLRIQYRSLFDQYVKDESDKGKDYTYTISIERQTKRHSREQENFRWGVLYPEILKGLRDLGWEVRSKNDVHAIIKSLFIRKDVVSTTTGEVLTIEGSSADLTTEEEQQLQDDIRIWAAEFLQIVLSEPNEQKTIL